MQKRTQLVVSHSDVRDVKRKKIHGIQRRRAAFTLFSLAVQFHGCHKFKREYRFDKIELVLFVVSLVMNCIAVCACRQEGTNIWKGKLNRSSF